MSSDDNAELTKALSQIGRVLAVLYAHQLGDVELPVKAEHLSRCGFSNTEIAELLGSTPNSINVALHRSRHPKAKKAARRKTER
jgi:hypothetical protein